VRAYRVICLLDVISKLVERTAGYLIADHLERKKGLHEGQYGCRKRRSCIDAVAVLMNRTQQAWKGKEIAGALLMDVKSAFNNVSKAHLGKRMEALELEPDLIRWANSFMTGRQVKLVLDGETGDASPVDTGIPQGSPAAPILFVTYLSGIFDEVERAVPGIKGLSFADDIAWWVKGEDEDEVAAKLAEAAAASLDWARDNGVAFDHGKTEAVLFRKQRVAPTATIRVGTNDIPFNTEATRWLGVWLDSQLTLKEHHAIRLKEGEKALRRLRRLTGQMGLAPVNCRKVMTACIQSVAMFGSELWWKGDEVQGTIGRAVELQTVVNKQARAVTGCFRTTNWGALAMESGLRPATAQLENRRRHFGLRLLSLPDGDQARELVGAASEIGKRLKNALAYRGRTETTVLLEEPEALDAKTIQEDEKAAKAEAERVRPGITMFTDGSRLDSGAAGYAVAWQNGQSWVGIKNHMGYSQEAYDAECAALARALEEAAKRQTVPERVTIFTDAQAAIRRMVSEDPGPGQKYAIQARRHIATLRRARPDITIEIRWCPAHKGVPGNEKADEWAKLAAEKPDARGVEQLRHGAEQLPRSLAHLKREISEKKWAEARQWAGGRITRNKYKMPRQQRPDKTVAGSSKRHASRFYQLKTGHCLTGQYLNWTKKRPTAQCWWCPYLTQTREHCFKVCPAWREQQKTLWAEVRKETGRWKSRWKVRDLLADERCSRAVLDFLATTDVGRLVPVQAEEDAQSEASEWELRERREREEERRAEAEGLGARVEEPLFLPTPAFMASAEEE
jgi:ribonuclease HI